MWAVGLSSISQNIVSTNCAYSLSLSLLFWILPPDLQSNLRDTVEAKREWSLWGCDLSYRDKLSLWVDVHSPGGVPSGQGEGEGSRCPTLDRPRRWASALMAPGGETVSWIHVHMYTHTPLCLFHPVSDGVHWYKLLKHTYREWNEHRPALPIPGHSSMMYVFLKIGFPPASDVAGGLWRIVVIPPEHHYSTQIGHFYA